jgi:2-hydroxy-3-keto-5-methylthiopentenyl-1-phosphate phosphatase
VEFCANTFTLDADGRASISLPYRDEACERCGTCKRNQMLVRSADSDVIVYIGDGVSDFCAAAHADLVFAKGALETHCREENISYRRFRGFDDVRSDLTMLSAKRALRRPRRAVLNRQAVWSSG